MLGVLGLAAHGAGVPQTGELRAVLGEGADQRPQPGAVRGEAHRVAQVGDGGLGRGDESSFVTDAEFVVDGGLSAH